MMNANPNANNNNNNQGKKTNLPETKQDRETLKK